MIDDRGRDGRTDGDATVMVIDEDARPAPPFRPYHILALLPTVGLLGGIPFANRVEPYVLGLPFLLFWVVAWVVTTSLIMAIIATLDSRHPDDGDARQLAASGAAPAGKGASS